MFATPSEARAQARAPARIRTAERNPPAALRALPDDDVMYSALAARDAGFIGVFFVGVRTTGIFCRPGCPARVPLRKNCEFFPAASGAMQAGYRPCRRCKPLAQGEQWPAWATTLIDRLETAPEHPITAQHIRALGVDPATASRFFKSRLGSTLPALARARRLGLALGWIREGQGVSKAALRSGFRSESGFRKAVVELFGASPSDAARAGIEPIVARWLNTPMGPMLAAASERGVCMLEFVDRRALAVQLATLRRRLHRPIVPGSNTHIEHLERELAAYFNNPRHVFNVPLDSPGTEKQQEVWAALRRIPLGETRSYAQVAREVGRPTAVRAVARANGDNRIAIIIPCHRVIGSGGDLTGYAGGLWRKRRLLEHEGALPPLRASNDPAQRLHAHPGLFATTQE
ncbi:MAG: methylated-DNA--[protein]-cysteine S-methyltransferase [Phycisphaerales bacterium]|nr:methylated-DNA--[protein]-cysteine S-methyltransferase [Phycisphaerales bacterium]